MRNRSEIVAVASFGADSEKVKLILPFGQPETMLANVSTKTDFQLFGIALPYSYSPEQLEKLSGQPGNTLVEVTLPYCFHIPEGALLSIRDDDEDVYLAFKKVWTRHAQGSSEADYRSPTHVLYHNKPSVQTPQFPHQLALGPEPICKGMNIEADKDRAGLYRYSIVRIFVNTSYSAEIVTSDSAAQTARSETISRAVRVVNRFIDVYRAVTRSPHIQRLPAVHVRDLYFKVHNLGYHGASFGHGIRTAIMNRSEAELNAISQLLTSGSDIAPWDLLFLDAEASLSNNQFTLAVVNAFQALELELEQFLEDQMTRRGWAPSQIKDRLMSVWRTKERLKELVPELTGRRLFTDDRHTWDLFCWAYDDIRNKLIHAACDLDHIKTQKTITACRDVERWLKLIG